MHVPIHIRCVDTSTLYIITTRHCSITSDSKAFYYLCFNCWLENGREENYDWSCLGCWRVWIKTLTTCTGQQAATHCSSPHQARGRRITQVSSTQMANLRKNPNIVTLALQGFTGRIWMMKAGTTMICNFLTPPFKTKNKMFGNLVEMKNAKYFSGWVQGKDHLLNFILTYFITFKKHKAAWSIKLALQNVLS